MTAITGRVCGRGDDLELALVVKDKAGNTIILSAWSLTYIEGMVSEEVTAISAFPHVKGPSVLDD